MSYCGLYVCLQVKFAYGNPEEVPFGFLLWVGMTHPDECTENLLLQLGEKL